MEEAASEAFNRLHIIEPKHFVLVHGAGHGAWCWFKLRCLLEVAGHKATCLDLAGAGVNLSHPSSILTFHDYNKPLFDFLSMLPEGHKVILVGHSAGGLSLTHSLHHFGDKIEVAIFVAATMLPSGFSTEEDVKDGVPDLSEYGDVYSMEFSLGRDKPPTSLAFREEFQRKLLYQLSPIEDVQTLVSATSAAKLNSSILSVEPISSKIQCWHPCS
ncbi:methylesterase 17 isoform X2 [Phalaenopsis equestris]|uniref:methylesterase 17 isoform X2 n=1 Tax=Phalaenopsis equestris TaxID=78828 RepID=UPI0009E60143|nr:methylesterase 17 isoform X2 [Phalaenopsis equestris]